MPLDLYIPPDALEVILDAFEGPLDLLLYLIRRHNLDVLDISMAELCRQYIKADAVPVEWGNTPAKLAQKDIDARWTKKGGQNHYGYKNHINIDRDTNSPRFQIVVEELQIVFCADNVRTIAIKLHADSVAGHADHEVT